ncbi:MAG: hypothetical protein VYE77_11400 [Planctomycetota bacterium]|nr:hypothetical protein [Planctomycetota bacterium]
MTRRDLLWVFIRCMGLVLVYQGVQSLMTLLTMSDALNWGGQTNILVPQLLLVFGVGFYCTFAGQGLLDLLGAEAEKARPTPQRDID